MDDNDKGREGGHCEDWTKLSRRSDGYAPQQRHSAADTDVKEGPPPPPPLLNGALMLELTPLPPQVLPLSPSAPKPSAAVVLNASESGVTASPSPSVRYRDPGPDPLLDQRIICPRLSRPHRAIADVVLVAVNGWQASPLATAHFITIQPPSLCRRVLRTTVFTRSAVSNWSPCEFASKQLSAVLREVGLANCVCV